MTIMRPAETGISEALEKASGIIKKGGVIAYPTETFYGLGVKYDDISALKKLYGIKHRSWNKALPLIIGEKGELDLIASSITAAAEKLAKEFWPGPLTLLLHAKPDISEFLTAKTGKIAVRIPGESFALDLARFLGFPITATSANISGEEPIGDPRDVFRAMGKQLDVVIDGGVLPPDVSSVVSLLGDSPEVLRRGVGDVSWCVG